MAFWATVATTNTFMHKLFMITKSTEHIVYGYIMINKFMFISFTYTVDYIMINKFMRMSFTDTGDYVVCFHQFVGVCSIDVFIYAQDVHHRLSTSEER